MKKVAIGVIALVVVFVVVMLLLPHFIDVNQYRGEIQTQLQNRHSVDRRTQFEHRPIFNK